jgi:hypothetical protein
MCREIVIVQLHACLTSASEVLFHVPASLLSCSGAFVPNELQYIYLGTEGNDIIQKSSNE